MSHFLMSEKELRRKTVFEEVKAGRLSQREAGRRLKLSYRHVRRSYQRFLSEGDGGLIHRGRGRPSNRGKPAKVRAKALKRYRERYSGFGPTLAAEKLRKEGLEVDHETLRRWLIAGGQWTRKRKRSEHREQRPRKEHAGEMVQMDGSIHRWHGPDRPPTCLMTMVDDATGRRLAMMAEGETTEVAMRLVWRWCELYGIPQTLYTDKKSVFRSDREPTVEEQLAGETPKTAFGKACSKLGIEIIFAHSPQAKGRVERSHGVYQDRFLKELALRGITTVATANRLLQESFNDEINAKFAREPAKATDRHRPVPRGLDLADVFSYEEYRTVQNDWTVRYENRHYQIEKANKPLPRPKDKILVRVRLDGSMQFLYKDKPLSVRQLSKSDLRTRLAERSLAPRVQEARTPSTPRQPTNSPWRQSCTLMFADTEKTRE